MSSLHEWIERTGTLSCHWEMMEKENKARSMLKESLVYELTILSIETKKRNTSLRPLFKNGDHWIFHTTKPCRGEEKAPSRRHPTLSSNSDLIFPHHLVVHVSSVISCHVTSGHMSHHYCGSCILYSKSILKWKSKGHTWNVKSHVSWKVIGSQIVMRVVKI